VVLNDRGYMWTMSDASIFGCFSGNSAMHGVTQFADMDEDEFKAYFLSYKPEDEAKRAKVRGPSLLHLSRPLSKLLCRPLSNHFVMLRTKVRSTSTWCILLCALCPLPCAL
jgi:hypothetical protein